MKKTRVIIPGWLILLAALLFFLYLVSLPNYIKVKDRSGGHAYTMTLDSGVDKKSSQMNYDISSEGGGYAPPQASEGEAYYGDELRAAEAPAAGGEDRGRKRLQGSKPAYAIDMERIKSWFVPSAYAADHQLGSRYLVRSGECTLQVKKYDQSVAQLEQIAARHGGIVSDSDSQRAEDDSVQGTIVLRIPSAKFAQAWSDVRQAGKVLRERVATQDVSQDYLANVSKLKNLVAEQAALQQMLDEALRVQRTRGLGEGYKILLDTQERLFAVIEELAATEDTLNALADQITRSTISITLTEKKELPAQVKEEFTWNVGTTAAVAYHDLLLFLRDRLNGLVYFLITCWTWLIPLVLLIWLGRWVYRRFLAPRGFTIPALVQVRQVGGSGAPHAGPEEQDKL